MIDAKEAKKKAVEANTSATSFQQKQIERKIKDAVGKGEYKIYVYEHIKPDLVSLLKKLGYEVHFSSVRNETLYTISWANPIDITS